MAKRGRTVVFHGAFGTKAKATAKEHRVRGGFVRKMTIRGHTRYMVLSRRGR